jgi:outer membrane protein assembly factor BamD (BamD/ComL family)
MKKLMATVMMLLMSLALSVSAAHGQKAKTGPDPALVRDAELEKDSLHNLEVARHYFKQKKAYLAALKRCEEIDAGNPTFARLDEVLYIAGESSLRLAEAGGQQKTKKTISTDMEAREVQVTKYKTADELRQDARVYLSRLTADFPNSVFRKQAEADLQLLGGAIKPAGNTP